MSHPITRRDALALMATPFLLTACGQTNQTAQTEAPSTTAATTEAATTAATTAASEYVDVKVVSKMLMERGSGETVNETTETTYTYSDDGTLTTCEITPSESPASRYEYIYDSDGSLTSVDCYENGEDYITLQERFTYNNDGRVDSYTTEVLTGGDVNITRTYDFDGTRRTACHVIQNATSEEETYAYIYDDDGYITKITNETTSEIILERDDEITEISLGLLVFNGGTSTYLHT